MQILDHRSRRQVAAAVVNDEVGRLIGSGQVEVLVGYLQVSDSQASPVQ
jgi:hypothetical protein